MPRLIWVNLVVLLLVCLTLASVSCNAKKSSKKAFSCGKGKSSKSYPGYVWCVANNIWTVSEKTFGKQNTEMVSEYLSGLLKNQIFQRTKDMADDWFETTRPTLFVSAGKEFWGTSEGRRFDKRLEESLEKDKNIGPILRNRIRDVIDGIITPKNFEDTVSTQAKRLLDMCETVHNKGKTNNGDRQILEFNVAAKLYTTISFIQKTASIYGLQRYSRTLQDLDARLHRILKTQGTSWRKQLEDYRNIKEDMITGLDLVAKDVQSERWPNDVVEAGVFKLWVRFTEDVSQILDEAAKY